MGYQPKSYRKFLATSVGAVMAASAVLPVAASAASNGSTFTDVPSEYATTVSWAVSQDIIKGYPDGTFKPFAPIDRAHAAVMIANAKGLKPVAVSSAPFNDVPANHTYAGYIKAVSDAGIFKGDSNGNFNPDALLTREQMATVLVQAFGLKDNGANVTVADMANVDPSHKANVQTLADLGITKLQNGKFDPKGNNTRINLVNFLWNVDQYLNAAPAVTSVSAINSTELKVTFNKVMNETSVENEANYSVTADSPSTEGKKTVSDVQLSADGKSAIVRLSTPLVLNTSYSVEIANTLTSNYEKVPTYDTKVFFNNDTAPTLSDVQYSDGSLTLSFNEEVYFTNAIVKVDGKEVSGFAADSTDAGSYDYSAVVSGTDAASVGTHTVSIVGLNDKNGNEAGTLTKTYTVGTDTTSPTVVGYKAVSQYSFKVQFNEAVTAPTVKVAKGATEFVATTESKPAGTLQKEWLVTVSPTAGTNNLFGTDENSVTLSTEVSGFQDGAKLLGNKANGSVTLSKDTVAPTVVSTNLNTVATVGSDTVITIPFSEDITRGTGTITVKDPDGILQDVTANIVNDTDLQLTITGKAAKKGTYTVTLGKGAVQDGGLNPNAAVTTTASYSTTAGVYELAATAVKPDTTVVNGKVVNYLDIDYATDMSDSAIDLSNYYLDNTALPAGSTIGFVGDKQNVRIYLPDSFVVPANAKYKFSISKKVLTSAGEAVTLDDGAPTDSTTPFSTYVTLTDNKAVSLVSAKLLNSGAAVSTTANEIQLTFSENLNGSLTLADVLDDFVVKVNGIVVTPTAVTDSTPGDEVLVLELPSDINASQTVTVQVASTGIDTTDLEGNLLTTGTTVTATK